MGKRRQVRQQQIWVATADPGRVGKRLLRRRAKVVERSFAHCYETGGMRRVHLRGRENIGKRVLIQAMGFNLSVLMRHRYAVGKPRCLQGRAGALLKRHFRALTASQGLSYGVLAPSGAPFPPLSPAGGSSPIHVTLACRFAGLVPSHRDRRSEPVDPRAVEWG